MFSRVFHRFHMTVCQVHHMDVVAKTGSIRCGIISSEYGEIVPSPYRHLSNIWHQIVRDSLWIFTNQSALMGSNWIEITEQDNGKLRISFGSIFQNLFHHYFSPTIRVGTAATMHGFHIRWCIFFPIHSGRRREHKLINSCFFHTLQKCQCGIYIIAIILQRKANGFSHCLKSGKMNDTVNVIL